MTNNIKFFFIIALLAHLLLFFLFSVYFSREFQQQDFYQPYYANMPQKDFSALPAYFAPPVKEQTESEKNSPAPSKTPTSKNGIEKPAPNQTTTENKTNKQPAKNTPLKFSAGYNVDAASAKKTFDDELLRLLHEATARTLTYPRMGRDFHVQGTVQIQFMISPNGQVSHAIVFKSSGFGPFDEAGLTAIKNISPVRGVDAYLKEPKSVTAVIVFK